MSTLTLVPPKIEYENEIRDFVNEFIEHDSKINGGGGLLKHITDNLYEEWVKINEQGTNYCISGSDKLPASTYFAIRIPDNKIIGTINIRHTLNDLMLEKGGHIGYSVRPLERRKRYATEILRLGLEKLREMGVDRALITCSKDNPASAGTIKNNLGTLENEIYHEESKDIIQRYWIQISL